MNTSHVKSVILAGLVLLSVGLSYVLWHGDWQNNTEVVYSDSQALPTAPNPKVSDVSRPYELLFTSAHPVQYALAQQDSPLFTDWLGRLQNLRVYALHAVKTNPNLAGTVSVSYRFGTDIAYHDLNRFAPGLPASALVKSANSLFLYLSPDKKSVRLALKSQDGTYEAETDMQPTAFSKDVNGITSNHQWIAWNPDTDSIVPKDGLTMFKMRFHKADAPLLPLVHSFFVNPQALSRIQENSTTALWTDGSRVVWWDQTANTITFANPNTATPGSSTGGDLLAAVNFVQNHGGTPENVLAFQNESNGRTASISFRTYVEGFPILGPLGEFAVEMQDGTIVQYRRPMTVTGGKIDETVVHTLGADQLATILRGLMPNTPFDTVVVQLGYLQQNTGTDTVELLPAYYISESGTPLWVIDASTGKVMRGMNTQ